MKTKLILTMILITSIVNINTMDVKKTTEKNKLLGYQQESVRLNLEEPTQPQSIKNTLMQKLHNLKRSSTLNSFWKYLTPTGLATSYALALADKHTAGILCMTVSLFPFFASLISDKIVSDRFKDLQESIESNDLEYGL